MQPDRGVHGVTRRTCGMVGGSTCPAVMRGRAVTPMPPALVPALVPGVMSMSVTPMMSTVPVMGGPVMPAVVTLRLTPMVTTGVTAVVLLDPVDLVGVLASPTLVPVFDVTTMVFQVVSAAVFLHQPVMVMPHMPLVPHMPHVTATPHPSPI